MLEGLEAVVGEDQQPVVRQAELGDALLDLAHKSIQAHVPIPDHFRIAAREHVLHAVQAVEDASQDALAEPTELIKEDLLA